MAQIHPATQHFQIGDIQVAKVIDTLESFSPQVLYAGKDRSAFDLHLDWLQPHFVDANRGMLLSIHTFVVKTRHHRVLVDTCVGNHKQGAGFPQWNDRNGNYLAELAAAGCAPEDVDYVFCTHMHVDHTGENTRLRDGRWVPTFPSAKYLFNRREWECWKAATGEHDRVVVEQNILPIIEADQVQWVDPHPRALQCRTRESQHRAGGDHWRHDDPPGTNCRTSVAAERRPRQTARGRDPHPFRRGSLRPRCDDSEHPFQYPDRGLYRG